MAGESIPVYGTTVNMITAGAARLYTEISVLADVTNDYVGIHDLCDLVFEGTFDLAPVANSFLAIYMRKMNSKGVNSDPIPDATYKKIFIGTIGLDPGSVTQTVTLPKVPIIPDCQLYVENGSGQTLNAGWTLDIKPLGFGVAP